MSKQKFFFSVDLGATSGRTIIGQIHDGKFELEEVTRFPNNLIVQGGHYYWDIYALYFEIIKGLKEVARRDIEITSRSHSSCAGKAQWRPQARGRDYPLRTAQQVSLC